MTRAGFSGNYGLLRGARVVVAMLLLRPRDYILDAPQYSENSNNFSANDEKYCERLHPPSISGSLFAGNQTEIETYGMLVSSHSGGELPLIDRQHQIHTEFKEKFSIKKISIQPQKGFGNRFLVFQFSEWNRGRGLLDQELC
ncbi:hypothetical protein OUZ56_008099 [Daphnia magna]|uniref:Uncharacterized protein n=1 Tax=Daphnia magna TaxID=35525 RepID=A0ABR0ABZ1_9CRUS|nr:hypothetical protein OUZ56_008099 [Daphnia magna]